MEDKVINSKKRKVIEQQSYFFDALIIENILLRLPVKSILRFKSVSKQWYSILSSSNFINAHFMKSPFSHPSAPVNTLFIQSNNKYYLYSYDDDDQISGNFNNNLVRLDLELDVKKVYTRVAGCCNGLICLTPEHGDYFIIWNPATRKMHKYESDDYLGDVYVSGFGYVSSVDDYKYVRISTLKANIVVQEDIIVHIFSRRENKWRKIYFYHKDAKMPLCFFGQAVLVNETLYWYAQGCGHVAYIVSFDIGVEKFDILMKASDSIIGLMGGCLSIYNFSRRFTGNRLTHIVPKVEPHAIVKPISVTKRLRVHGFSQMIGFTRTGKIFMTGPPEEERSFHTIILGIVDTSTKLLQYKALIRFHGYLNIARYVPSLFSPFPIEEPSKT